MPLKIDADFEGGNIAVAEAGEDWADLTIRQDANGPWFQWFYFRVQGAAGKRLTVRLLNAGQSSYPEGWDSYLACISDDDRTWRRTGTRFADGVLEITCEAAADTLWFAYFAPYDLSRHERLLARAAAAPGTVRKVIGRSVDCRPVASVSLGSGPRQVWLLGRQHSGETMASWWMEGVVERLVDPADAQASRLLAMATVHLVPLVNIDGAARGHLRGNAAGLDLNRQWIAPDPARAPEVAAILEAMAGAGVDLCLDVHGDETLPHVFLDGCDVDPAATPAQIAGVRRFKTELLAASPAFQTKVGYPPTYGGDQAATICTHAVARRFDALALTLEMPFKDSVEQPDPVRGWSLEASARLGRDMVPVLATALEGYEADRRSPT